jgi:hypothetical protein
MTKTSIEASEPDGEWTMKDLYPYAPELHEVEEVAREERIRKILADNIGKILEEGEQQ